MHLYPSDNNSIYNWKLTLSLTRHESAYLDVDE